MGNLSIRKLFSLVQYILRRNGNFENSSAVIVNYQSLGLRSDKSCMRLVLIIEEHIMSGIAY